MHTSVQKITNTELSCTMCSIEEHRFEGIRVYQYDRRVVVQVHLRVISAVDFVRTTITLIKWAVAPRFGGLGGRPSAFYSR
jgi:hypothetical protein